MSPTSTRMCPRGENKTGIKGSFVSSKWFNVTLTLGKLCLMFPWVSLTRNQGWCVVFVAVGCVVITRHRKRFSREAEPTRASPMSNGYENVSRLVDVGLGGSEKYHVNLPSVALGKGALLQEPSPAYIPHRRGRYWRGETTQRMSGKHGGSLHFQRIAERQIPPGWKRTVGQRCNDRGATLR